MLSTSGSMAATKEMVGYNKKKQETQDKRSQTQPLYEAQIKTLCQRILELEKVIDPNSGGNTSSVAGVHDFDEHQSRLQWSMSGLVVMGGSSASKNELQLLQSGSHDPKKNGFTTQALSLGVHTKLDRNIYATSSIVSRIKPDGESVVELEQAFIHGKTTLYNLSFMAGQYFLDFGEENKRHPDDWDFVDVPFLITRLFGGDKLRSQGIQVDWQFSSSSTLLLGASNPGGETVTSFFYNEGKEVAGHALQDRDVRGLNDLLYSLKLSHQFSARYSPHHFGFGASALFGPNATGDSTDTQIFGLNFGWAWYGNGQSRKPRFNWRTEWISRRYEAGDKNDPSHESLKDYGVFSQAVWQPDHDWAFGLRAEFADGNKGNFNDTLRENRKRYSINVTRQISKSVKWRLQYNRDLDDSLQGDSADSFWLQMVFRAGAHDEHE